MVLKLTVRAASAVLIFAICSIGELHKPYPVKVVPFNNVGCKAQVQVNTDDEIRQIDLSPLNKTRFRVKGHDAGEVYELSICHKIDFAEKEPCSSQMMVYENMYDNGTVHKCHNLGDQSRLEVRHHNKYGEVLALRVNHSSRASGNNYIYLQCSSDEGTLECDQDISLLGCSSFMPRPDVFVLKSKYACLGDVPKEKATPTPTPQRDWTKLSPGTIILIAVGCVFVTYMVIGVAHGVGKGEKGFDRLPNADFWQELPYLVKDGAVFVFGGCSKPLSKDGYIYLKEDKHEEPPPAHV